MLRVLLDDHEGLLLLTATAEDFARGDVPEGILSAFMLATMNALPETGEGVPGIATGTSFRRLVAKTLARQFMEQEESTRAPFQFALSTRAGTDCVGHAIRVVTERQPDMTVLSIDGISAYDHVYRSSMMSKLLDVPGLQKLLPFVRKAYSQPSRYAWEDREDERHWIWQHESGEQGDPLMPLLFSLAFLEVRRHLREGNSCSHTLMMCTSFQSQTAPAHFTTCWLTDCTTWQGSSSMKGKLAHGTLPASALPGWPSWGPMCGARVE